MLIHRVRAEMAPAEQEHGEVEARGSKGSIVHRCTRTMVPTGEGDRSRIEQHVLLEMVPNAGGSVLLVQMCSVQES